MKKVLFISSSGGHFAELKLLKKTMENFDSYIVVEKTSLTKKEENIYDYLMYGSRSNIFKYFFVFLNNFLKSFKILFKLKPNVIVSTGAHSCVVFFYLAKIFKIKTIYIESFAKVNNSSMTYRLIKNKADVIIVQHNELKNLYTEAKFFGGVY